ncbi:hypothetical protein HYT26_02965 [Candidatus Pacearchaeota archaeon]|nr:hypothetical protein [Candidatus Pacearchaeota archaeon]
MIKKKDNSFRDLLGELFLVIGGFILAETIINQFLSLSFGVLPIWVLPLFSILLIIAALDFKNHQKSFIKAGIFSVLIIGGSIILIVLVKNNMITSIFFLWSIFILSLVSIIIQLLLFLPRRKNRKS